MENIPNSGNLIMLVDDSRTNLMAGKTALGKNYSVMTVASAKTMLESLEWCNPDLILLDVVMPDMNGFEAIRILKERPRTCNIPVVFLTARNEEIDEMEGLQLGAIDYIRKPFSAVILRKRVELYLQLEAQKRELRLLNGNLQNRVEVQTKAIQGLQNKVLAAIAEMIEGRDGVTGNHIANTRRYLRLLLATVAEAGYPGESTAEWNIDMLCLASQLHDVGKIGISDSILKKPGPLTSEEFEEMKRHVILGIGFIEHLEDGESDVAFLRHAKLFAGYHHEKWDGSGYPHGLSGDRIPLLGRLMAIADVYDALTSERPYKKAFSHNKAVEVIRDGSGKHFDPALVATFGQVASRFPSATIQSGNHLPRITPPCFPIAVNN